jgi:hypothetical protein
LVYINIPYEIYGVAVCGTVNDVATTEIEIKLKVVAVFNYSISNSWFPVSRLQSVA